MAKTWAIFRVYDYKGGELSSSVNLSYKSFIGELCELFDNVEFDDLAARREKKIKKVLDEGDGVASDIEYIKDEIAKYMKGKRFYSLYAGGDGFCGEIYEVDNGVMRKVKIEDYLDDIAKQMLNYLK